MRLNVFAAGMTLTEAMESAVKHHLDKLSKLEDFIGESHLEVTLRKTGNNFEAESRIRAKGKDYFVKATSNDMYEAIEQMAQKLARTLQDAKNKCQDHKSPNNDFILDTDDTYADELLEDDFNSQFDD